MYEHAFVLISFLLPGDISVSPDPTKLYPIRGQRLVELFYFENGRYIEYDDKKKKKNGKLPNL